MSHISNAEKKLNVKHKCSCIYFNVWNNKCKFLVSKKWFLHAMYEKITDVRRSQACHVQVYVKQDEKVPVHITLGLFPALQVYEKNNLIESGFCTIGCNSYKNQLLLTFNHLMRKRN